MKQNLNSSVSVKETGESPKSPIRRIPAPDSFTGKFQQTLVEEITLVSHELFQKTEEETISYLLCEAA